MLPCPTPLPTPFWRLEQALEDQLNHQVPWLLCAQMGLFHLFALPLLQAEPANSLKSEPCYLFGTFSLAAIRCFACHGQDPKDLKGGFHLESRETLAGGDQFVGAPPGNASESGSIAWFPGRKRTWRCLQKHPNN